MKAVINIDGTAYRRVNAADSRLFLVSAVIPIYSIRGDKIQLELINADSGDKSMPDLKHVRPGMLVSIHAERRDGLPFRGGIEDRGPGRDKNRR